MRKYAWILVASLLLSVCSAGVSFARTPEEERTPLQYVCMEDTFFVGSIMEDFYKEPYALEDRYEDEKLQEMMASVELDYPIDTQEEIKTISWALYDIGVAAELIDPELKPNSAERYAEGIWHFTFNKATADMLCYTGDQVSFLISGEDGHIITLRTEMLFLDPFSSGSWKTYNGSDELAPGEWAALRSITWNAERYNERLYATEEHSVDEWATVSNGRTSSLGSMHSIR